MESTRRKETDAMGYFRRMCLVCAATAVCSSVAGADALHGFCSDCGGNSPVGATAAGPLIDFGFWNAGTDNSGTYFIDILTPDNGVSSAPPGTYTITGGASGTAALFSSTAWTSGKLDSYLGIRASPSNPLSAWLHATQSLDPKAMGYWVFQANLGLNALGTSSGTGPLLNLNSTLPQGSVIAAFLETSTSRETSDSHETSGSDESSGSHETSASDERSAGQGNGKTTSHENGKNNDQDDGNEDDNANGNNQGHGNNNSFTATAHSGALFETAAGSTNGHGVPEPGTAALLITALFGFVMRLLPRRAAWRLPLLTRL
jgi:hypothetical protein